MDTTASARGWWRIAARRCTRGPTPSSEFRVITTVTPCCCNNRRTRWETSKGNACSGYPSLDAVPVVLHGLVLPRPAGTGWLISSGAAAFPPLCPGSRTTTACRTSAVVVVGGAALERRSGERRVGEEWSAAGDRQGERNHR